MHPCSIKADEKIVPGTTPKPSQIASSKRRKVHDKYVNVEVKMPLKLSSGHPLVPEGPQIKKTH